MYRKCACCGEFFDATTDKGCRYSDGGTAARAAFLKSPGFLPLITVPVAFIAWGARGYIKNKSQYDCRLWYCSACSSKISEEEYQQISDLGMARSLGIELQVNTFIFGTNDYWSEMGWK